MPSPEPPLGPTHRRLLREVARESIVHGLRHRKALPVEADRYPDALRQLRATFVTLRAEGRLRGCTGSLEAARPLVCDVAENAHAAAFRDPRFAPLAEAELGGVSVHLSLLSAPEPLPASDREHLLARLRPGMDGLILTEGRRRATFLPAVWESLGTPGAFLDELLVKAGLPPGHWSAELRFSRYTVESI